MAGQVRTNLVLSLMMVVACAWAAPARAQWTVSSSDGNSSLTLGFFAQVQAEGLRSPGADTLQQNVFLRRVRIMGSAKINSHLSASFVTDAPNVGKGAGASGNKTDNTMVLQDFVLTQSFQREFKLDAGMLLVPLSHNSTQSAASLLAVDYGPYSYLASDVTGSKVGRDYGVQARGYLGNNKLEYRAAVLQGFRGLQSHSPMRTTFRAVLYPFAAETSFTYTGTTQGKRKIVALGVSADKQRDYQVVAGDAFVDLPVPGGDAFTAQADVMQYDGGKMFTALAEQTVMLFEVGWYFHQAHVTPFVQYATRDYKLASSKDETKLQGGLAWWGNGHKMNVKLALATLTKDGAKDGTQVLAQWQVLAF